MKETYKYDGWYSGDDNDETRYALFIDEVTKEALIKPMSKSELKDFEMFNYVESETWDTCDKQKKDINKGKALRTLLLGMVVPFTLMSIYLGLEKAGYINKFKLWCKSKFKKKAE